MGCLIKIEFTEKASEKDVQPILFNAFYIDFFRKCKVVSETLQGQRKVLEVYVRHPENVVSNFLVNVLIRNNKVKRCQIIS